MGITISVLGSLSILHNGQPASGLRSRKALALFLYLAIIDQPVPRTTVAHLLWPDNDETRARANLSWALNHLKKHFPGCISAERHTLRFLPNPHISIDLHQLQTHFAAGDDDALASVVSQANGALLDRFGVDNNSEFEYWLITERERVRQLTVQALTRLIDKHEQAGDPKTAIPFAEKWVALMPWRDVAHHALIRLLAASGQQEAALSQFEQCKTILQNELAVEPSAETVALINSLNSAIPQPIRRKHNISRPALPLIGRQSEMSSATKLLEKGKRLISIVGVGGVGKSRLAIELAWQQVNAHLNFLDGVYFVPAIHLQSAESLAEAIGKAVGAPPADVGDPVAPLLNFLRRKKLLLVIDNFEQLMAARDFVVSLLEGTLLQVVITSQKALRISAETILPLKGLALRDDAATALFEFCARQQMADFRPNADDTSAINTICKLVEGNPLAIQLAANWITLLSPATLLQEIKNDISFIEAELHDLPERHRSLRALFNHAWAHLNNHERDLLARLALFDATFSFKAAQAVTTTQPSVLLRLVNRSLVEQDQRHDFRLHSLVRAFAAEKLQAKERQALLAESQTLLAEYAATLLKTCQADFQGDEQVAISTIEAQWSVIQTGWYTAQALGRWDLVSDGLQALDQFVTVSSQTRIGLQLISDALEELGSDKVATPLHSQLATRQGIYLSRLGRYDEARATLDLSIAAMDEAKPAERALALMGLASIDRDQGRLDDSKRLSLEALALLDHPSMRWRRATCLNQLGMTASRMRDIDSAETYYTQSLQLYRSLGSRWAMTQPINNLAIIAHMRKQHDTAQRLMAQNAALYAEIGDRKGQAITLTNQATLALETGNTATALSLFERSLPLCRDLGDRWLASNAFSGYGYAQVQDGQLTAARSSFVKALSEAQAIEAMPLIVFALIGFAQLFRIEGDVILSAEIITRILHHPELNPANRTRTEKERDLLITTGIAPERFATPDDTPSLDMLALSLTTELS